MSERRAVVLLSGGQDSTTCLFWAQKEFDAVEALSIYYGQRHASEVQAARNIAALACVPHKEIHFPALQAIGGSALVNEGAEIKADGGLADKEAPNGLPTSFVPGRNLLFLGLAGAYAVARGIKDIVTGVCETDYSGYPDCRSVFIDSMARSLSLAMPSESGPIEIHTPLMYKKKAAIVRLARSLREECWSALAITVTCYEGKWPGCGQCPSCKLRAKGFAEAHETDPAFEMASKEPSMEPSMISCAPGCSLPGHHHGPCKA